MLLVLDYKRHWNEFEADIDIRQSTNLYFLMMWNIRDVAGGVERFTSSWFSVSATWWQPRTAWEAAVQPAAHYYIRKLEAQKPKGHTYIKQMVTHTSTQKREKFAVRLRLGSALQSVGELFLGGSDWGVHIMQHIMHKNQAGWVRCENGGLPCLPECTLYQLRREHVTAIGSHRSLCKNQQLLRQLPPRVCYHKGVV